MCAQIFFATSLRGSGSVPTILVRCSEGCIGFIEALFCPRRSTLTWQEPRSLHLNGGESPARPPPLNTKAGFINCTIFRIQRTNEKSWPIGSPFEPEWPQDAASLTARLARTVLGETSGVPCAPECDPNSDTVD